MIEVEMDRGREHAPRLLVVEDDPLVRFSTSEILREAGYDVSECTTADEALSMVRSGLAVEAILTDVRMPGVADGFDLARFVKKSRPEIAVVVCSGYAAPPADQPFDAFVAKPFASREVLTLLDRLLARSRSAGS